MSSEKLERLKKNYKISRNPEDYIRYLREKNKYRKIKVEPLQVSLKMKNPNVFVDATLHLTRVESSRPIGKTVLIEFVDDEHRFILELAPKNQEFLRDLQNLLRPFLIKEYTAKKLYETLSSSLSRDNQNFFIKISRLVKQDDPRIAFYIDNIDAKVVYDELKDQLVIGPKNDVDVYMEEFRDFPPDTRYLRVVESPNKETLDTLLSRKSVVRNLTVKEMIRLVTLLEGKDKVITPQLDSNDDSEPEAILDDVNLRPDLDDTFDEEYYAAVKKTASRKPSTLEEKLTKFLRKVASIIRDRKLTENLNFDISTNFDENTPVGGAKKFVLSKKYQGDPDDWHPGLEVDGYRVIIDMDKLRKMNRDFPDILDITPLLKKWSRFKSSMTFDDAVRDLIGSVKNTLTPDEIRAAVNMGTLKVDAKKPKEFIRFEIKSPTVHMEFGFDQFKAKFGDRYVVTGIYSNRFEPGLAIGEMRVGIHKKKVNALLNQVKKNEQRLKDISVVDFTKFLTKNNVFYYVFDNKMKKGYQKGEEPWLREKARFVDGEWVVADNPSTGKRDKTDQATSNFTRPALQNNTVNITRPVAPAAV